MVSPPRVCAWIVPADYRRGSRPSEAFQHMTCSLRLHLSSGASAWDGRDAACRILEAAGAQRPAVIYMTTIWLNHSWELRP